MKKDKDIKRSLVTWLGLINNKERYYVAKAMDIFYEMPAAHQDGFLRFVVGEMPNTRWEKLIEDPSQFLDAMRSILYYYSGRKALGEPTREEFKSLLCNYFNSKLCLEAERRVVEGPMDEEIFKTLLEE